MQSQSAFTSNANPSQIEAICHVRGPLLIIAGPGSGKTFTLVERIVYLISEQGVAPEKMLILTFTDKAAGELKTRISNRLAEAGIKFNLNEMYLGTFHSICLRILEEFREFTRLKRNYSLMDEFDQQYFLYQKQKHFETIENIALLVGGSEKTSSWKLSDKLKNLIDKISEEAVEPEILTKSTHAEVHALGQTCLLYRRLLEEENALDFSTIQFETLKLLQTHKSVKKALRERFEFVMVDEYQDTNTIQELFLRELTGENPNLCVVGDDDQGLYRFRGASIRNILEFRDQFPAGVCSEVTLSTNYRSHPDIVEKYDTWMGGHFLNLGKNVFRQFEQINQFSGNFAFTGILEFLRIQYALHEVDFENLMSYWISYYQCLKNNPQLSSESREFNPGYEEFLKQVTFAAQLLLTCNRTGESLPLEKWSRDLFAVNLFTPNIRVWFADIYECNQANELELIKILKDMQETRDRRLLAALMISVSETVDPETRFYANVILITSNCIFTINDEINHQIETPIVDRWRQFAEKERVAILSTNIFAAQLLQACDDKAVKGISKAAKVLICAKNVVKTKLTDDIFDALNVLANYRSKQK